MSSQRTFQLCRQNTLLSPATLLCLFFLQCQLPQGGPAEVGRTGTLEGGRSQLDPDTSALSRAVGLGWSEAFSQPLRPHL